MISVREQKEQIHTDEKRQHNREPMAAVRAAGSGNERYYRNLSCIEAIRQLRGLFQGHDFNLDKYLNIGKMDSKCTYCGAFHFVDERVKISSQSDPSFSICF